MDKIFHSLFTLLFLCVIICTSCQQIADEDPVSESTTTQETSSVSIQTRAADTSLIQYPAYIYVFSSEGKLVTSQKMASEGDALNLALGIGDYNVVAVAGVGKGYTLPEQPSLCDAVSISSDGFAQSPMMTGRADLSITKSGRTVQLDITLSYAVSALSVCLQEVPQEVTGVKISLSSLYTSMTLDGTYGGGRTLEVDCEQDDDDQWNADALYVFPSSDNRVVYGITFEYDDRVEKYSYTYHSALTAGTPFTFVGVYKGESYVGGTLSVAGWADMVNVDFTFGGTVGDEDSDGDEDNETPSETVTGHFPQLGAVWNGGLVVQVENATDTEADVLLMSLEEWSTTASEAESKVAAYQSSTGQAWRMITSAEAKSLKTIFTTSFLTTINETIASQTTTYDPISNGDGIRYLCLNNGVPYTFRFEADGKVTKAGSTKSYLLRAVREVHYKQ